MKPDRSFQDHVDVAVSCDAFVNSARSRSCGQDTNHIRRYRLPLIVSKKTGTGLRDLVLYQSINQSIRSTRLVIYHELCLVYYFYRSA